jgi:hypothetical protein
MEIIRIITLKDNSKYINVLVDSKNKQQFALVNNETVLFGQIKNNDIILEEKELRFNPILYCWNMRENKFFGLHFKDYNSRRHVDEVFYCEYDVGNLLTETFCIKLKSEQRKSDLISASFYGR